MQNYIIGKTFKDAENYLKEFNCSLRIICINKKTISIDEGNFTNRYNVSVETLENFADFDKDVLSNKMLSKSIIKSFNGIY